MNKWKAMGIVGVFAVLSGNIGGCAFLAALILVVTWNEGGTNDLQR